MQKLAVSNSLPDKYFLELAEKWLNQTITEDELGELEQWYQQNQDNPVEIPYNFASSEQEHRERILSAIKQKATIQIVEPQSTHRLAAIATRRLQFIKYAAAAAVLVLVSTSLYLLYTGKYKNEDRQQNVAKIREDILPPKQGAILTLSNGKQIVLDSAIGNIAHEGGVSVVNKDGSVIYNKSKARILKDEIVYNTISTPKGRQYHLTLHDGSTVWLNAASSVRFPAVFTGRERIVEITGEVYFDVVHDDARPFIVHVSSPEGIGMQVEVLGTHFNINSYNDDGYAKTTLLDGKVRVTSSGNIAVLKPGQQAEVDQSANQPIRILNDIDLEEVMAWKNGIFHFNNANIRSIMKQVERWYDVDIVYEVPVDNLDFSGHVGKKGNVSHILKIMELTGLVHFEIKGRTITVKK